jgi:four helix bundle protein
VRADRRSFCNGNFESAQQVLRTPAPRRRESGLNIDGRPIAAFGSMKEPSEKRKRTLALHDRALRFTNAVNTCCPQYFTNKPSATAWDQLVRAADGTSNNLIEADAASSDADFLSKMGIALREAKESRGELAKIRMGHLDHHEMVEARGLESEASQLSAVYATIILNMRARLDRDRHGEQPSRKRQRHRRD